MAYRCTLVNYNKCTTFVQDVDIGEAVHAPGEEPSVLLVQFCCEPKTALKNKVLSKKKKKKRILEWVLVPFSRGSSRPRDQNWVSCIAGRFFTI